MPEMLPQLGALIEERVAVMRRLAESLELSQLSLARNDAEAIARGAAHQAELCRQWSLLETQLRQRSSEHPRAAGEREPDEPSEGRRSAELQAEWEALSVRIRHLARVHCSLLRYLERSMSVLQRIVQSCAPTYMPEPSLRPAEIRLRAGELLCRD